MSFKNYIRENNILSRFNITEPIKNISDLKDNFDGDIIGHITKICKGYKGIDNCTINDNYDNTDIYIEIRNFPFKNYYSYLCFHEDYDANCNCGCNNNYKVGDIVRIYPSVGLHHYFELPELSQYVEEYKDCYPNIPHNEYLE